jgi:MSHA pilin protein MshC
VNRDLRKSTRPGGRVFVSPGRLTRGYTLVELVVVMVLLGILSATALPRFFAASRFEAMGFTDASVAAASFAQRLALSSGCDTLFSIGASGYALHQRANSCHSGDFNRAVSRPGGQAWRQPAPLGVSVSELAVFFDGSGQPFLASSGLPLHAVATYSVGERIVAIEHATGFVHLR